MALRNDDVAVEAGGALAVLGLIPAALGVQDVDRAAAAAAAGCSGARDGATGGSNMGIMGI